VRSIVRDLRFAVRMLRKQPGFAAFVVIALGLGLGVSTSVFSSVNVLLLRPLAVKDPQQLSAVFFGPSDAPRVWGNFSYPDYADLLQGNQIFSGVIASGLGSGAFSTGDVHQAGNAERAETPFFEWVSDNYFDVLGVPPLLGRTFTKSEGAIPGAQQVIVIGHALWQRRFHADPGILGRKVYLNMMPVTIIGVMPPTFGPFRADIVDYWVPLGLRSPIGFGDGWITDHTQRDLRVLVRLRPGVTAGQAEARMNVFVRNLAAQYPATNANTKVNVVSEIEGRYRSNFGGVKLGATMALVISGLVLLISCANVANLLLARATARTRELAIRVALGASRGRIVRQLLTESILLGLLGGGLGLLFAFWFGDLLRALLPPVQFQFTMELEPELRTYGWALAASLLAGLASGAFPAWRSSRVDVTSAMKTDTGAEGQALRRAGLRQLLVVGQLAISVMVVVSGGLFLRSLQRLGAIDPGIRTDNLISAELDPGLFDYNEAQIRQFFSELTWQIERLPGVRSVSSAMFAPLIEDVGSCGPIVKEGDAPPLPNQWKPVLYSIVHAKYFETIGTELLFGRDFDELEREGIPSTIIINAELARQLFGHEQDAIGRRLRIGEIDSPLLQVVGIARDGRYSSLFEDPKPYIYLPGYLPALGFASWTGRTILIRAASARDLPSIVDGLRAEVAKLDGRVPVDMVTVAEHHLDSALADSRLAADVGTILGLIALGLATMGMYSVMTYTVSHRTKEIGIRMALGAQVRDIIRLVVTQALGLIAAGIVVGTSGALTIAQLLKPFLFGVSAVDPGIYLATLVLLVSAALLATLLPSRRAARVDPMVALRYE
jgi:putative ABC transport system permease protein